MHKTHKPIWRQMSFAEFPHFSQKVRLIVHFQFSASSCQCFQEHKECCHVADLYISSSKDFLLFIYFAVFVRLFVCYLLFSFPLLSSIQLWSFWDLLFACLGCFFLLNSNNILTGLKNVVRISVMCKSERERKR